MKTLLVSLLSTIIIFSWLVYFHRDYNTGKWYWKASHIGWGWDHPTVHVKPRFGSKAEAVSDWENFILSQGDREWKEKS